MPRIRFDVRMVLRKHCMWLFPKAVLRPRCSLADGRGLPCPWSSVCSHTV